MDASFLPEEQHMVEPDAQPAPAGEEPDTSAVASFPSEQVAYINPLVLVRQGVQSVQAGEELDTRAGGSFSNEQVSPTGPPNLSGQDTLFTQSSGDPLIGAEAPENEDLLTRARKAAETNPKVAKYFRLISFDEHAGGRFRKLCDACFNKNQLEKCTAYCKTCKDKTKCKYHTYDEVAATYQKAREALKQQGPQKNRKKRNQRDRENYRNIPDEQKEKHLKKQRDAYARGMKREEREKQTQGSEPSQVDSRGDNVYDVSDEEKGNKKSSKGGKKKKKD
ncbi:uncharacterized protein PG986_004991 [Apiospora aurea]|uniref:Uncharacterized protein n=1 Tax=Apiospora aurea TaxID=335848 RepID=A0ABR1QGP5_9PEZI